MNTGLLWYDDSTTTTLADKIIRAADRYRQKYGRVPNACYVHPTTLSDADKTTVRHNGAAIHVEPASNVLRHHFWIGEEASEQSRPSATTRTLAPALAALATLACLAPAGHSLARGCCDTHRHRCSCERSVVTMSDDQIVRNVHERAAPVRGLDLGIPDNTARIITALIAGASLSACLILALTANRTDHATPSSTTTPWPGWTILGYILLTCGILLIMGTVLYS